MGKNTKIVCTVVPNPIKSNPKEGHLNFSLFLSPRLPDSGILKDYYEILKWPDFMDFFTKKEYLSIELGVEKDKKVQKINSKYNISKEENNRERYRSIWREIFPENTPVKGWILDEGKVKDNLSTPLYSQIFSPVPNGINPMSTEEKEKAKKYSDLLLNSISIAEFLTTKSDSHPYDTMSSPPKFLENLEKKYDDKKGNVLSESKIQSDNKDNQEFHKKMSFISDYPHLMRMFGWIYDYSLALDSNQIKEFQTINCFKIFFNTQKYLYDIKNNKKLDANIYHKWENFFNEIDFKTPWTFFNNKDFSLGYMKSLDYFEIENGFIITNSSKNNYTLIAQQFNLTEKYALEKSNLSGTSPSIGSSSTGIGIQIQTQTMDVVDSVNKSDPDEINNAEENIDDYIIYGHNLDVGYRIDVAYAGDNQQFFSLNHRVADYGIDKSHSTQKNDIEIFLEEIVDEPWIAESAQAGKSGNLHTNEEICRWNNWSLTCPHIGNYPQDESDYVDSKVNKEFNDIELINIKPSNNRIPKLLPLRFGKSYKFRIRVVDICGNGPEYNQNISEETYNRTSIGPVTYKRLELVNPPELHLIEPIYSITKRNDEIIERKIYPGHEGESLETLVIKTKIIEGVPTYQQDCIRLICPPRVSFNFAELHGALDSNIDSQSPSLYNKAGYEADNEDLELFEINQELPFLTDPLICGFDFLDINIQTPLHSFTEKNKYLTRKFATLRLTKCNNPIENKKINDYSGQKLVHLCPGDNLTIILKSKISDNTILLDQSKQISPGKKIHFVHAVQQPICKNNSFLDNFTLVASVEKRSYVEPTIVKIVCNEKSNNLSLPTHSSIEFKLIAEYEELILNPEADTGYVRIKTEKQVLSIVNTENGLENDLAWCDFLTQFNFLKHSFGDTKFRKVAYSLEFISKFKEYFPEESDFSVIGKINELELLNTEKPKVPVIDGPMIPLFNWIEEGVIVTRVQNSFRIYFKGDWYLSGDEEKIAVLFLELDDDPENNSIPDECEGLVSEFGKDPTLKNPGSAQISQFKFKGDDGGYVNIQLLQREESKFSSPIPPYSSSTQKVKAAIFDVLWDKESKRFYVDIQLTEKEVYFPFAKFAICRYQENSIKEHDKDPNEVPNMYDLRFSSVVMSPQAQIFPTIAVNKVDCKFVINSRNNSRVIEQYLILEKDSKGMFNKLDVNEPYQSTQTMQYCDNNYIDESKIKLSENAIKELIENADAAYLEEYEIYSVYELDNLKTNIDNPRNDIRKRLVFSYKLK